VGSFTLRLFYPCIETSGGTLRRDCGENIFFGVWFYESNQMIVNTVINYTIFIFVLRPSYLPEDVSRDGFRNVVLNKKFDYEQSPKKKIMSVTHTRTLSSRPYRVNCFVHPSPN
jgi:hypothetical protein